MIYVYIDAYEKIEAISKERLPERDGFTALEVADELVQLSMHEYLVFEGGEVIKKQHSQQEVESLTAEKARLIAYKTARVSEYPSIGDQLDALFHAGVFPTEMAARIQAVKDANPKP